MTSQNCPFCNIDKEKSRIIEERKYVYVMFSNPRLMPGHLLIIPKRHIEKMILLEEAERKELFDTILEYQEKITQKIAEGCDVRQNYRPFIPQSMLKVDHVHVHLQPRTLNDALYQQRQHYEAELFKNLTQKEISDIEKFLMS